MLKKRTVKRRGRVNLEKRERKRRGRVQKDTEEEGKGDKHED